MADEQTTPPENQGTPWHQGADDDTLGYIRARGLEASDPMTAFKNVMAAHKEAEKLIGAPANEVVRWPKDASDAAGWQAVRTRLGVPADPNEYDFSGLKKGDVEPDAAMVSWLRERATALHLTKDQAADFAKSYAERQEKIGADRLADTAAKQAAEAAALKAAWGQNFDLNRQTALNVAQTMMEKSGMSKEDAAAAVNALEGQVGGAKVMEMFRAFSQMANEDTFTAPSDPSRKGEIMSYQEAKATKEALMRDTAWVAKWNNGDAEASKQMAALDTILVNNKPQSDEDIFRAQVAAQYTGR